MELVASLLSNTDVVLAVVLCGIVVSILLLKRIIALAIKVAIFGAKLAAVAVLALSVYSQTTPPADLRAAQPLSLEQIGESVIKEIHTFRQSLAIGHRSDTARS